MKLTVVEVLIAPGTTGQPESIACIRRSNLYNFDDGNIPVHVCRNLYNCARVFSGTLNTVNVVVNKKLKQTVVYISKYTYAWECALYVYLYSPSI